jgi:nucleoid-associated protein YgaU
MHMARPTALRLTAQLALPLLGPVPRWVPLALTLALVFSTSAHAQVLRCESPAGAVTYSNGGCPPGTAVKREVPPAPAVTDTDRQRAQSQAKAEAARAQKLDQAERADAQQRERERAAEAKKAQEREKNCRKLALQLQQAEDDLSKATVNKRASAEKTRNRARERYELDCR